MLVKKIIMVTLFLCIVGYTSAEGQTPSPAGWWKMDDGSGTTAIDSSGNGYDGTLMGDAVIQDGVLVLDGNGDYVQTTLFEPIQTAPDGFTIFVE